MLISGSSCDTCRASPFRLISRPPYDTKISLHACKQPTNQPIITHEVRLHAMRWDGMQRCRLSVGGTLHIGFLRVFLDDFKHFSVHHILITVHQRRLFRLIIRLRISLNNNDSEQFSSIVLVSSGPPPPHTTPPLHTTQHIPFRRDLVFSLTPKRISVQPLNTITTAQQHNSAK